MASYSTSDFKKGIKVQIDGDPYIMIECNFVKPGKGNALYKCKLRNLLRNTVLDRTYKGGDSLEAADVEEIDAQYLYQQGDRYVFMDNTNYEQYELTKEQVDDAWKWVKEGMVCSMVLFNNNPISVAAPNHVVLKIEYCEPAIRGNTATNLTKPVKLETGAEIVCPAFVEIGDLIKVDTRTSEYLERKKLNLGPRPVDFRPTASWKTLRLRAELLARVRTFFAERGFLEVETPLLSADVVVDHHIDPIGVLLPDDPRIPEQGRSMWLQTSPEFAMKRLMAAGGEAIYQITRSFRSGEAGRLHNPEFTIVEWYRLGDSMEAGMQLLSNLAETLFGRGPAERVSYAEAFQRTLGIDPHRSSVTDLTRAAERTGISIPESFTSHDRDAWLDLLLVERIEATLGITHPTILFGYPVSQAALAQVRTEDVSFAERFELYLDGIELANGYGELLDPNILRSRNHENNRLRSVDGKPPLPEDSRLLIAMEQGLPACTGVALGFDRAVMLIAGANSIAEVMTFPIDRA